MAGIVGTSLWFPVTDEAGYLVVETKPPVSIETFYQLALAACDDAVANAMTTGVFDVRSGALLRQLQNHFINVLTPSGWDPLSGLPKQWTVAETLR